MSSESPQTVACEPESSPGETGDVDADLALAALEDPDCRRLLRAVDPEALTAGELIERCEIPRSTVYRKIERLTEAGLLEERIRLRSDGRHASEYRLAVDDLTVSISGSGGIEVGVARQAAASGD
jgi:DNA-binding transcriptional ArsR family regulator